MRGIFLFVSLLLAIAAPLAAKPIKYAFDYEDSNIGFFYVFDGQEFEGRFAEFTGDVVLDFQQPSNSSVNVIIDTTSAQTSVFLATDALKSPKVLAVKKYPEMRFVSRSARREGNGAIVTGDLTVRDVTHPVQLDVTVFRDQGTEPTERDTLILRVRTSISRSDFNAGGYPDMVEDEIKIDIRARINRVE